MRHDLLGLPLELALERLKAEGITPEVQVTNAPRRRDETAGDLRVVSVSGGAETLIVSRCLDPIAAGQQESCG